MGQTIAEKILAAHADRHEVRPGEFITARIDLVLANDITGPPTIAQFRGMGATRVFDPERVALVPDHFTPPKDVHAAALITAVRAFAREQRITHYWEMGEVGIEHTLLPEEGLVRPWMILDAINLGLPILASPAAADAIPDGATVRIDLARGLITCGGNTFSAEPFPPFLQRLIASGGLVPYVRERLAGGPGFIR